jgi:hypothetical protein
VVGIHSQFADDDKDTEKYYGMDNVATSGRGMTCSGIYKIFPNARSGILQKINNNKVATK